MRAGRIICIALVAAAALGAAAPAEAQGLRVRLNADIRSTDPGVNRDANTDAVVLHMVEGLVAFREDASVGPLLAESMVVSEDGRTYTFRLRENVRFHNGAPLTSEDVAWTWRRYMTPETRWRCLTEFDGRGAAKLIGIETPDARTVVFRFESPSALIPATMARPDCGGSAILHRDSVGPDGAWLAPIGTGPFRMGEWRRGQSIELIRFDSSAARSEPRDGFTGGKRAEVERVRFLVIPDQAAGKAALLSGAIDVLTDIASSDLAELKARPEIRLDVAATMGLNTLLIQTKDPLLADVRIRRALALALDLPALVQAVSEGTARYNASAIPVSSAFHTAPHAQGYTRDLAAARRLLAEAGYRGQTIRMLANRRYASMFDAAVLAQAMAQEAGLRIELEVLDWATQLDRYTRGDYQLMSFSYSARLDPSLSYEMFSGPKATQPRKVWDNAEALALLRESMVTTDTARRRAIFEALHRKMLDEVPLINLYNGAEIAAMRANVSGYQGWPAGHPRLWGVRVD
ncbi:ABC transporter substrate-binding protein [Elioraea sp. Yellowstone]|jgi:peptide/nickel transport system substrate-binding protein|uniref:ABC transporter substrate-binding protein n=1 Tax=Elioraea sp. Yellowstone TaxID=2592070 RepID=UPI00114E9431|nr:ABC transporter substrate-binding protein [Elioraea sp. Yellowstone]TQF76600.1 ABC transporter substrate-binding protein [Elioraea sp. Yellowstone]